MLNEGAKAQHTNAYVSISLSEEQCKIYQSELIHYPKLEVIEEILC